MNILTKDDILLLRRALSALRVRQELNCISCSDAQREVFNQTIRKLDAVDNKLCVLKPASND